MLWRLGLPEDFSDFAAAAAPEAFPAPLDAPVVSTFKVGDCVALPTADGPGPCPGPPTTESPCPMAAMALTLSLGRVLVEPTE